jgi:hypothetical protein
MANHRAQIVELNASIVGDDAAFTLFYAVKNYNMSFYRIRDADINFVNCDGETFMGLLESEYEDWGILKGMSFTDL